MKFARCQECGNTEVFDTERPFCDGAGDALRRHARTRTVEVSKDELLEVFGMTEDSTEDDRKQATAQAEEALGLDKGELTTSSYEGFGS